MKKVNSRRRFIGTSAVLLAGTSLGAHSIIEAPAIIKSLNKPNSNINGVQIGVITYSYRSMQDQSAEATLKYVVDSGISAIELMGDPVEAFAGKPKMTFDRRGLWGIMRKMRNNQELTAEEKEKAEAMQAYNKEVAEWRATVSMKKFKAIKKMYKAAGVSIYCFKPSAFGQNNTDAEIDYGFRAAKAVGASHITLEHPSDDAHTKKLGMMAKKHKIYVAYHGHTQQHTTFWDTALAQSPYNAMNIDIGHYVAAGMTDTLELVKAKHQNISSMHVKDRKNKANGQANLPWGEGDTPIKEVLNMMSKNKYKFPATIELEYKIPDGSDAVKEVRNCMEFCRKMLA